jgi:hypothetical protein
MMNEVEPHRSEELQIKNGGIKCGKAATAPGDMNPRGGSGLSSTVKLGAWSCNGGGGGGGDSKP